MAGPWSLPSVPVTAAPSVTCVHTQGTKRQSFRIYSVLKDFSPFLPLRRGFGSACCNTKVLAVILFSTS